MDKLKSYKNHFSVYLTIFIFGALLQGKLAFQPAIVAVLLPNLMILIGFGGFIVYLVRYFREKKRVNVKI